MPIARGALADSPARGRLPGKWPMAWPLRTPRGLSIAILKPANVMVGDDGRVKILDFGLSLAKLPPPISSLALGDTVTAAEGTVAGSTLGTVGYMSPEQRRSRPADFRAHQFSFGVGAGLRAAHRATRLCAPDRRGNAVRDTS